MTELRRQQDLMKERMSKNKKTKRVVSNLLKAESRDYLAEDKEIQEAFDRGDIKCPYCKKNPARLTKRRGLLPCAKCFNRRISLFKYGLTLKTYFAILEEQGGRCAICNLTLDGAIHVDHCHDLGHTRGLLCGMCNTGLGMFKDDEESLKSAANYLFRNRLSRKPYIQSYRGQ